MSLGSDSSDPTDFEGIDIIPGILPVSPDQNPRKEPRTNAATAASAAGVRAFTAQAVAFYFRAPAKAFFRTRVDYLAYARNLQHLNSTVSSSPTSRRLAWLSSTTPGVLASAIKHYGWRVIPEQILPPLLANVGVGAVLYTSYLQILGTLHEESAKATKRVYPPPLPSETFTAGLLAGSIQSFIAAPLDAIQVRYERNDVTTGAIKSNGKGITQPQSMWTFGHEKLREIGVRGVFAGWGLSFLKDSFGSAIFFSTFEWVKAQGYYNFLKWYYGALNMDAVESLGRKRPLEDRAEKHPTIRPHYAIEPAFLFLAGFSASIAQQSVIYPLYHIQVQHWDHLEDLDEKARELRKLRHLPEASTKSRWLMLRVYYHAYQETWAQCRVEAAKDAHGNIRRWLYRGFWWNTIRQVPSTSAGLIIFELVRRKYGVGFDEVRINRDGYDILLN